MPKKFPRCSAPEGWIPDKIRIGPVNQIPAPFTSSSHSILPVPRPSAAVRHSKNPDQVSFHHVGDIKVENFQIHTPVILSQPWRKRMLRNPVETTDHLTVKPPAQTGLLVIIIFNFCGKFCVRFRVKLDPHDEKCPSILFFTSSSGMPLTRPDLNSWRRRSISLSQASCTSVGGSVSVSESSSRMRASLRRSGPGNSAASCVTSVSVFGMAVISRKMHGMSIPHQRN